MFICTQEIFMVCILYSDFTQEPYNPEAPGINRRDQPPYWPEGLPPFMKDRPPPPVNPLPVKARLGNRDLVTVTVKQEVKGLCLFMLSGYTTKFSSCWLDL